MNSLADIALEYIESKDKYGIDKNLYHYNCAEVLLNACNDYYKLNVSEEMLKAVIPFGGGMCSESTCGILTGSLMALGLILPKINQQTMIKLKV
ncbi:MAG: C_GCAxxG_C_C family protein [Tissierellia bacterium]|nr:C_GCAxxG_C_C family protein [Tissierellia bacterium]